MPDNKEVAAVWTAFVVGKLALLMMEFQSKVVRPGIREPTPDELANILSQLFLWWLLPLFKLGIKSKALTSEMLPDIEPELTRPGAHDQKQETHSRVPKDLKRQSIFHHLFAVRGWLLIRPILPRLLYTGFMYAQPFLVQRATDYMSEPTDENTYKIGGGLIGAYLIVYTGISVRKNKRNESRGFLILVQFVGISSILPPINSPCHHRRTS